MSSLQYLEVVFCFLSLTELTSFLFWVLCCEVFKFWVNSFDGSWNKEWQEPKLGDEHGTPKIIQGHQEVKAWVCPGRHPLFCPLPSVIYLELYFYSPTWYVKFWVNYFDGLWNKEWQEPKLGDAHGTPKIIQGHQKVKAWGCPGRHPLFRLLLSVTLLGAIFLFTT